MKRKVRLISCLLLIMLVSCSDLNTLPTPSATSQPTLITAPVLTTDTPIAATLPEEKSPQVDRTAFEDERLAMVSNTIAPFGIDDPEVLRVMQTVPRHLFVPENLIKEAYSDHPLPIGYGQTISQPYIVALMTQLLELQPGDRVLEIGTGSGYQAAVLAEIGSIEVYSIEIIPELAVRAEQNLSNAGYESIHLKQDDGYFGWEEHAPFDAIIVTAAPDHIPSPLAAQLEDGGVMVIPIGPPGWYQTLWKFTKSGGELVAENMGSVSFVPFTGEGTSSQKP